MNNKHNRILWLINHTTLREFEVPLLLSFNFEVFTPKVFPSDEANRSASIDHQYDKTLTIPPKALAILNKHDFYSRPLTPQIEQILNTYFETVFIAFFPKMMDEFVSKFKGRILLRTFGLASTASYEKVMESEFNAEFHAKLQAISKRFWFAQSYPHLVEVETNLLKKRAVTLPLGLPDSIFSQTNTWRGGENKILFVCPRIASSPTYYGAIYQEFKNGFKGLPYIVAGAQPIQVKDPNVTGFQTREDYNHLLRTCAVMFYHSREPRHLHYHPLEAVVFGMPLIYMRDGMLEQLGGEDQPGACATYLEARDKIRRILNGDAGLIKSILTAQQKLLETFTWEFNRKEWENNFINHVLRKKITNKSSEIKTIGVFVPVAYRGGTLNAAKNLIKMMHLGSREHKQPVNLVFSCVADFYDIDEDFADLLALNVSIRETVWRTVTKAQVQNILLLDGNVSTLKHAHYLLPTDEVCNFNDCDYWIIVSDRTVEPLAPIKPYGMLIFDYIQRYIPELLGDYAEYGFLESARAANFVLTTTPSTRDDAIQYVGLDANKVHLFPMEFNPFRLQPNASPIDGDYFIWTTNTAIHKNHAKAFEALDIYYGKLNGKFKVVMTGVDTNHFDVNHENDIFFPAHLKYARDLLTKMPLVTHHLIIKGNVGLQDYISLLAHAKFLWHPTIIDNGTFSVVEAAYYGIPSLSNNYPQMQFINNRFHLNLCFGDATDPLAMAKSLKKMELEWLEQKEQLPAPQHLDNFSYNKLAPEAWQLLQSLMQARNMITYG